MKTIATTTLKKAFTDSIPILISFIPLGFGFGYIGQQLNMPWHLVIIMATIIYAGSVEFLVVTMLAKAYPFLDILLAAALVNLRHIFYGLSVHQHYPRRGLRRAYMIHALTDETYSLLAAKQEIDHRYAFYLCALNHLYWVTGVSLGVTIGHWVAFKINGLEFCLTALFVVLAMEQFYHLKKWFPFIFAFMAASIAKFFFPQQMLMMAMIMVTVMLVIMNQLFLIEKESVVQ